MRMRALFCGAWMCFAVGCGIAKEEHERLMLEASTGQKAAFDAEMQKMQKAHGDAIAAKDEQVRGKDTMIGGLEAEVKRVGGDLAKVRTELGDRVVQLASAKTELAATEKEVLQLRQLREQAEREATQFRSLADKLRAMIDAGKLEVVMRKGRISLKLPDDVLFPSGSKKLKTEGRAALVSVAGVLAEVKDRDFVIAGHTDNVPVKKGGAFDSNWDLSTARAVEVVKLMIENGVPGERIAAAGYGEFDPVASNDTKENREKNRRLEIILMPKIEDLGMSK